VQFYCDKAIELDPEYPESYFMKAMSYNTKVSTMEIAITYFLKTIDLAPNHAEAHSRLGNIYFNNKQEYAKGLYHLNKAMELKVDADPAVYFPVSFCLMHAGFYEKAKDYLMKIIIDDDFVNFDSRGMAVNNYAWILIVEKRYDEALVFLDTMIHYNPDFKGWCRMWQVQVPIFEGNLELAELYLDTLTLRWVPLWQRNSIAWMYQQAGRDMEATEILDNCIRIYEKRLSNNESYHNFFILSSFYALKGDKERAIELYARSIDTGEDWGYSDIIETNFAFENLMDEPEFRRQVQRSKDKKAALYKQILEMQERGEINL
jgi:tetratricopeptide (TPR) repeat protein